MKEIESIKKELEGLKKSQAEASEKLAELQAGREGLLAELGDKLISDKEADTKAIEGMDNEVERLSLMVEAYGRRITLLQEQLKGLEEEKRLSEIERLEKQSIPLLVEIVKQVDKAHELVLEWQTLSEQVRQLKMKAKHVQEQTAFRVTGLTSMGVPIYDMFRLKGWSETSKTGNVEIIEALTKAGLMDKPKV